MYGSALLTEHVVDVFREHGLTFIERDHPDAPLYHWYYSPPVLLTSRFGRVGHLATMRRIDSLQLDAIHELQTGFGNSNRQVSYGSKSTTVLREIAEIGDGLHAQGYARSTVGDMLGIYGNLGRYKRPGRGLKACLAAAARLVDTPVDARIFYGLHDATVGRNRLEQTVARYLELMQRYPGVHLALLREMVPHVNNLN